MKKKHIIIIVILVVLIIGLIIYLNTYYKASDVNGYLSDSESIKVLKKEEFKGYLFDGPGEEKLLIFYPGAKVEYTAYAPIMNRIAQEGIDTLLIKMPFNIALLDINAANKIIISNYKYDSYYLGGHSLGGVAAASYVNKFNPNDVKGLILLASYSTKKIDIPVLSIYGSNDKVLNIKKYKENKKNIPNNNEVVIDGGNHAYFGNYGEQKGDGKATIEREEQQNKTVLEIVKFIKEN